MLTSLPGKDIQQKILAFGDLELQHMALWERQNCIQIKRKLEKQGSVKIEAAKLDIFIMGGGPPRSTLYVQDVAETSALCYIPALLVAVTFLCIFLHMLYKRYCPFCITHNGEINFLGRVALYFTQVIFFNHQHTLHYVSVFIYCSTMR